MPGKQFQLVLKVKQSNLSDYSNCKNQFELEGNIPYQTGVFELDTALWGK